MNIQAMMAQARKLQKEIEKISNEIETTSFKYENENILLECLGTYEITKVQIKNEDVLEDKEMLEDVLMVAINELLKDVKSKKEEKLGKYTNGLGGIL